ncbi:hypothetical protein LGV61_05400 [Desulfurispirillum indicum]|uniref:hypothetical protein n=1 Tax=Desulfurispirillum indicum TaxID=936456 RepID=UPI001CF9821A|nr:hypothetical protein [Desulfurispirillum indicum]UCZ57711.1 hypothetical protein LGV61_05400 [Desulfurispirillum indicum]
MSPSANNSNYGFCVSRKKDILSTETIGLQEQVGLADYSHATTNQMCQQITMEAQGLPLVRRYSWGIR